MLPISKSQKEKYIKQRALEVASVAFKEESHKENSIEDIFATIVVIMIFVVLLLN